MLLQYRIIMIRSKTLKIALSSLAPNSNGDKRLKKQKRTLMRSEWNVTNEIIRRSNAYHWISIFTSTHE